MGNNQAVAKKQKEPRAALDFLSTLKAEGRQTVFLDLDVVRPDPNNPRTTFRPIDGVISPKALEALQELADDIASRGLLQPIIVREDPELGHGRYMICYGERRWRATMLNRDSGAEGQHHQIEAFVVTVDDLGTLALAQLSENLQREDLSDMEVAASLSAILEAHPKLRQADLVRLMNKTKQWVSRIMALLKPEYSELVEEGYITYATILEQYKALPKESQQKLLDSARETGKAITKSDVEREKASLRGQTSPTAAAVRATEAMQGAGVAVPPVAQAAAVRDTAPAASRASPAAATLPQEAIHVQEVRMHLNQVLLLAGALPDEPETGVSVKIDVPSMRKAITRLGAKPVESDLQLAQQLMDLINAKTKKPAAKGKK